MHLLTESNVADARYMQEAASFQEQMRNKLQHAMNMNMNMNVLYTHETHTISKRIHPFVPRPTFWWSMVGVC